MIATGLATADDRAVLNCAAARGLAVVSKDADFAQLSAVLGPPPKVIWLRIGNGPTREVVALLQARAADVQSFLADPAVAMLIFFHVALRQVHCLEKAISKVHCFSVTPDNEWFTSE